MQSASNQPMTERLIGSQKGADGIFLRDSWVEGFVPHAEGEISLEPFRLDLPIKPYTLEYQVIQDGEGLETMTLPEAIRVVDMFRVGGKKAQIRYRIIYAGPWQDHNG